MSFISFPRMLRVRQRFEVERASTVVAAVRDALAPLELQRRIRPGDTVAIGVGSRGIANLADIVRELVAALRAGGAEPYVVPAMGSHGGATADGQRAVLATYGVTEPAVGAPIRASMDVVALGTTDDGIPIHFARDALEATHVVIVNRIKPHTTFSGTIESGLAKMLSIGFGKHVGAAVYHRASVTLPWDRLVHAVGRALLARVPVSFGLAILENAYDETAHIEGVPADALLAREVALLQRARRAMPRLPVDRADLLIVDEMGKHISGLGMDTNITGRKPGTVDGAPSIRRVFVRELAPESHGNAHGIGLADFTTTRLVRALDRRATMLNALTAVHPEGALVPMHFDTDREAIEAALGTIGLVPPEQAHIVRIRSTRHLGVLEVSEPCVATLRGDVEVIGPPYALAFDGAGNLHPFEDRV